MGEKVQGTLGKSLESNDRKLEIDKWHKKNSRDFKNVWEQHCFCSKCILVSIVLWICLLGIGQIRGFIRFVALEFSHLFSSGYIPIIPIIASMMWKVFQEKMITFHFSVFQARAADDELASLFAECAIA